MFDFLNTVFTALANGLDAVVFFNILFFTKYNFPLVMFVLIISVIYFTVITKFINFRMINHSIKIFFEKEKEIDGNKAVTSKSAFLSAISGCVGVGSISGAAAAIFMGGPGAVFWMFVIGFLIMPVRYAEVFLGHFFRTKSTDGTIEQYGPYAYLDKGLKSVGYSGKLSKILFVIYVIAILFGAVGAFIMQVNPLAEISSHLIFGESKIAIFIFCAILALISLFVAVGGLKRIIHSMQGAVSFMSFIYLFTIIVILGLNFKTIPEALSLIFTSAFKMQSVYGGIIGTLIISFTRTIVATEVGLGTVSLIHGKSQSDNSAREALLSMGGPFFANFIFITLNSIAILATSSHINGQNGILMISSMFKTIHNFFPFLLLLITFLFAFTTIIAWYFYGESSIMQITKKQKYIILYRVCFFLLISVSGSVSFGVMLRIIDATVFSIVFPNVICLMLLGKVVKNNLPKKS